MCPRWCGSGWPQGVATKGFDAQKTRSTSSKRTKTFLGIHRRGCYWWPPPHVWLQLARLAPEAMNNVQHDCTFSCFVVSVIESGRLFCPAHLARSLAHAAPLCPLHTAVRVNFISLHISSA